MRIRISIHPDSPVCSGLGRSGRRGPAWRRLHRKTSSESVIWPYRSFTFPLLTERDLAILVSVTEEDHLGKPTDPFQGALDLRILKILVLKSLHGKELEQEAANWNRLSSAISRVAPLKEA